MKLLDESAAAKAPPPPQGAPNGKAAEDRVTRWRDNLARDPWVEESLNILADVK